MTKDEATRRLVAWLSAPPGQELSRGEVDELVAAFFAEERPDLHTYDVAACAECHPHPEHGGPCELRARIDVDPPARPDYCNGCGDLGVINLAGLPFCAQCAAARLLGVNEVVGKILELGDLPEPTEADLEAFRDALAKKLGAT